MKKYLLTFCTLILAATLSLSFINKSDKRPTPRAIESNTAETIQWYKTWDEAVAAVKKTKKPMFIDLYTNWCGWCKRMDATTFKDEKVAEYMNKHFVALKFNAEQKEEIKWRGNTLKYIKAGRRGVHELAYSLLDGRLGYPSFVYLDPKMDRITISPGYKKTEQLMSELVFVAEGHYKTKTFEEYKKEKK